MKGILVRSLDEYKDFWKSPERYFKEAYGNDPLLGRIQRSYSALYGDRITEEMIGDMGLL